MCASLLIRSLIRNSKDGIDAKVSRKTRTSRGPSDPSRRYLVPRPSLKRAWRGSWARAAFVSIRAAWTKRRASSGYARIARVRRKTTDRYFRIVCRFQIPWLRSLRFTQWLGPSLGGFHPLCLIGRRGCRTLHERDQGSGRGRARPFRGRRRREADVGLKLGWNWSRERHTRLGKNFTDQRQRQIRFALSYRSRCGARGGQV